MKTILRKGVRFKVVIKKVSMSVSGITSFFDARLAGAVNVTARSTSTGANSKRIWTKTRASTGPKARKGRAVSNARPNTRTISALI